jgi:hypothetical protein
MYFFEGFSFYGTRIYLVRKALNTCTTADSYIKELELERFVLTLKCVCVCVCVYMYVYIYIYILHCGVR